MNTTTYADIYQHVSQAIDSCDLDELDTYLIKKDITKLLIERFDITGDEPTRKYDQLEDQEFWDIAEEVITAHEVEYDENPDTNLED